MNEWNFTVNYYYSAIFFIDKKLMFKYLNRKLNMVSFKTIILSWNTILMLYIFTTSIFNNTFQIITKLSDQVIGI